MMRRILFIFLLAALFRDLYSQTILTYEIDSLKQVISTDLSDTSRIWALNNLGRNIVNSDTVLVLAEQAITLSRKIGVKEGEAEAYNNLGYWYVQKGNYPKALDSYLKSIQLSESINFEAGLKRSFNNISFAYWSLKDYNTAISYARKSIELSIKLGDHSTRVLSTSTVSRSFLGLQQSDSALKYAQQCYEIANRIKDPLSLHRATATLGDIHAAAGNHSLAMEYLRLALRYAKMDKRNFRIAGSHQVLADVFKGIGNRDSSLWHAQQAFNISQKENLSGPLLSSSLLLSQLHEERNYKESLRYQKFALAAQDSLFSQEKNMQVAELNFNETMRQRELEAARLKAEENRKHNLQYAAIAIGVIVFVIFVLLLSHSIIANETLIRFLGVLALLIVFEFINLLVHPLVGDLTHHSPLMMLAIMVCIAALLIPLHHKLEKWIVHRLVEKNKKIRLQAAKKIVSTLEGTGSE
jgi:tetratricopeptide (TPR) repeat protein